MAQQDLLMTLLLHTTLHLIYKKHLANNAALEKHREVNLVELLTTSFFYLRDLVTDVVSFSLISVQVYKDSLSTWWTCSYMK